MPIPILFDGVTLRNLAVAEQLDLCPSLHADRPLPRWTSAVAREIAEGASFGNDDCITVQEFAWLGAPIEAELDNLAPIFRLSVALRSGKKDVHHLGEAESIFWADKLGGLFVTDDNAAYDFAARRLGGGRVIDTVHILREAVAAALLSPEDASAACALITENDRHLRRGHPPYPAPTYFQ